MERSAALLLLPCISSNGEEPLCCTVTTRESHCYLKRCTGVGPFLKMKQTIDCSRSGKCCSVSSSAGLLVEFGAPLKNLYSG